MPPKQGRGRRDNGSDNDTDSQEVVGTFETLRDEGEHFVHVKQFQKAVESFTKALEFRPGDKTCLVRRSNCYLMLGNADAALADANEAEQDEDGKKDIRAYCMKAEALYQKGDFETALVFYHRGNKLRPELQEFRLGIQKCQEAINNSIGTPESVKLESKGDLTFFYKQEEGQKLKKQKQQQKIGYSKPQPKKEEKKERKKPVSSSDSKTTKELLGELFQDKEYLEKLFDTMSNTSTHTGEFIRGRACDGLEYLHKRADFWGQQKPMYARKRDKQKQAQAQSAKKKGINPMEYILIRLEQIDEAQAEGNYDESLQKSRKTMRRVEEWSDEEVKNKLEVIANLHSCMGNAYLEMGKHKEALEHHEKDLEIGKQEDNEEVKSRAYDNLGRVMARMGKYEQAIEIWEEKLPMSKTALEKTWLYHEIGRCYIELEQYSEARDYGEKSLAAAKEANDEGWQLHSCVLVAQAEAKCGDLQASADSFERALEMARAQRDSSAEQAIKKALEEVNDRIVRGVQDDKDDEDDKKSVKSDKSEGKKSSAKRGASQASKVKNGNKDDDCKDEDTSIKEKGRKSKSPEPEKSDVKNGSKKEEVGNTKDDDRTNTDKDKDGDDDDNKDKDTEKDGKETEVEKS